MSIYEIEQERKQLESKIADLVTEFANKTEVSINAITITTFKSPITGKHVIYEVKANISQHNP